MRRLVLTGRRNAGEAATTITTESGWTLWIPDDAPATLAPPDPPKPDAWANDPDRTTRRETWT